MHTPGNLGQGYWQRCGNIDPQFGMMFLEAMLFAIDKINSNSSFLYGLKIATRIHDTCGNRAYQRLAIANIANYHTQGIIGPQYSDDAKTAATVFDIFGKAVISYSATSPDLSNRMKYRYFYRTVPSDKQATKLLVNLALKFEWRYVAIVRSMGNYGERFSELFIEMAYEHDICIPVNVQVEETVSPQHFIRIIDAIVKYKTIKVVFLFLTDTELREFFQATESVKEKAGNLTFVVGDGWGTRVTIAQDGAMANGSLTYQIQHNEVTEFRDYYLKLRPTKNPRNIWFDRFWEEQFNCSIKKNNSSRPRVCSGNERITDGQGYYSKTPVLTVINAVYAFAHAFRKVIQYQCINKNKTAKYCVAKDGMLQGLRDYRGVLYRLQRSYFQEPFRDAIFQFNTEGEKMEDYDILNFYLRGNDSKQQYQPIGTWKNPEREMMDIKPTSSFDEEPVPLEKWRLSIDTARIEWKNGGSVAPVSICSKQCKFGEIQQLKNEKTTCCWTCVSCQDNDRIINNTCLSCDMSYVPDTSRKRCKKLPVRYTGKESRFLLPVLCSTGVGLLLTLIVIGLFIYNFNKRVVKASGRELCLIMLIGIACTYLAPVAFIFQPSNLVCNIHRFAVGLSLSITYAPLLLKVNRIYRIFRSAKTTVERPIMISPRSQIFMSIGLTAIEVLIGIVSLSGSLSIIKTAYPTHRQCTLIYCELTSETVLVNLTYSSALMLVTTWFAFKTRNFPKNYNEAKYIGHTMYATCLVLAVFLPIFYFVDDKEGWDRVVSVCCLCYGIATINLLGLFGSRVRLILSKNVRIIDPNMTFNSTVVMRTIQRVEVTNDMGTRQRQS